jgi:hypothetical protein
MRPQPIGKRRRKVFVMEQTNLSISASEGAYNEYFTPQVVERIQRSIAQAERGELISFTMAELEAMEAGEIPQRALEFLGKRKGA